MAIHFSESELSERRRSACRAMVGGGLHGLLLFRQETVRVTESGCERLSRLPLELVVK